MSRVTIAEWYSRVNALWPAEGPELTAEEGVKAARKLYRFAMGKTWPAKFKTHITSGRRYSQMRNGVLIVNPGAWGLHHAGWQSLVHALSHDFHYRLSDERPHGGAHARLEIRMIKEVLKRGWLEGTLKTPEPVAAPAPDVAKADARAKKIDALARRLTGWERRQRRAETAIKKIKRSLAAYARADAKGS